MRKYISILPGLFLLIFVTAGCEKMLEVDSERIVLPDKYKLDEPDAIGNSMYGLFKLLDKISLRYVLLGELRGELMDITDQSSPDLKEIYNFNISKSNAYNSIEDYYSIINNCNYLIKHIDTSIVANAEKILYRDLAAVKAIRAWTCMQVALNYGRVSYFEEPIMYVEEALQNYPEYSILELAPILINDLEPFKDIPAPEPAPLGEDITTEVLYFPIRYLLGDLYLWTGEYEQAATVFHDLMYLESIVLTSRFQSRWDVINGVFVDYEPFWYDIFFLNDGSDEQITMLAGSTEYGEGSPLDSIAQDLQIAPSGISINYWQNQLYNYNATVVNQGDLREMSSYFQESGYTLDQEGNLTYIEQGAISKFHFMSTSTSRGIHIYRTGLFYLRYAEAVNRAGKPNAAFAVLKNGMNQYTFRVDSIVPPSEKYLSPADSTIISYLNFTDPRFNQNIGVHARGCGNIHLSNDYRIPDLPGLEDSIKYVEDLIIEELALETAFEGNRFHDLIRIATRRSEPSYLADRVSSKYDADRQAEIKSKLMDQNNWYLTED